MAVSIPQVGQEVGLRVTPDESYEVKDLAGPSAVDCRISPTGGDAAEASAG